MLTYGVKNYLIKQEDLTKETEPFSSLSRQYKKQKMTNSKVTNKFTGT